MIDLRKRIEVEINLLGTDPISEEPTEFKFKKPITMQLSDIIFESHQKYNKKMAMSVGDKGPQLTNIDIMGTQLRIAEEVVKTFMGDQYAPFAEFVEANGGGLRSITLNVYDDISKQLLLLTKPGKNEEGEQ